MKEQINFREKLKARQEKTKSLVCVGLDPLPGKLPACITTKSPFSAHLATDIALWMIKTVDKTAPFTAMYKLQRACWEAFPGGTVAMQMVISYIELTYPDIVIFVDCKRGDIGRTQECYRIAQFDIDGAQGMNFSPYMGEDCMEFLVDKENIGRAVVGLCYTSNPKARETQDQIMADGRPYWEFIATATLQWAENSGIVDNAGLVMAAAYEFPKKSGQVYSQHLTRCREIVGNKLWLLIPGVGTQGGYVKETVRAAFTGYGSMAINSSSEIIFASAGEDFAEAAGEKARQLYLAIVDALDLEKDQLIPESLIAVNDPIGTLKNCQGYYESLKGEDDKYLGPVVGYAKKYLDDESVEKQMVGFIYLNWAKGEQVRIVNNYVAQLVAKKVRLAGTQANVIIGMPMGGLRLSGAIGDALETDRVIYMEKVVTEAADKEKKIKEKSYLAIERHDLYPGDRVIFVEDVVNNGSTVEEAKKIVESRGAEPVAIVCGFNRSGKTEFGGMPIIAACEIALDQYKQDAPEVKDLIAAGNFVPKPKHEWNKLNKAMEKKK